MNKKTDRESLPAASSDSPIDTDYVRDLAKLLAETDLTEIEIEKGDLRIRVARAQTIVHAPAPTHVVAPAPVVVTAPAVAPLVSTPAPADHPGALKSPMVGTAYRRPSPEAKPFVEVGAVVAAGDKILLVEAMKTFNEIVAQKSGTVREILVEDGSPVEYGQILAIIE